LAGCERLVELSSRRQGDGPSERRQQEERRIAGFGAEQLEGLRREPVVHLDERFGYRQQELDASLAEHGAVRLNQFPRPIGVGDAPQQVVHPQHHQHDQRGDIQFVGVERHRPARIGLFVTATQEQRFEQQHL
jgi:hypothetical protein